VTDRQSCGTRISPQNCLMQLRPQLTCTSFGPSVETRLGTQHAPVNFSASPSGRHHARHSLALEAAEPDALRPAGPKIEAAPSGMVDTALGPLRASMSPLEGIGTSPPRHPDVLPAPHHPGDRVREIRKMSPAIRQNRAITSREDRDGPRPHRIMPVELLFADAPVPSASMFALVKRTAFRAPTIS